MARRDESLFDDPDDGAAAESAEGKGSARRPPLAERMRPRTVDEIVGQDHLLARGEPLRTAIDSDALFSMILWGPPGSGKTTIASAIRAATKSHFEGLSAVLTGVRELRDVLAAAAQRRQISGRGTVLFIDEIHRYNKSQQDALLPAVESGDVVLAGATTENPSFEVVGALLSRCRVLVVNPLSREHVVALLRRALADSARGLGAQDLDVDAPALAALADATDGDARRALGALEVAVHTARQTGARRLDGDAIRRALARKALPYDKSGEEHYNLISALHKSIRNSDADASLYWLARIVEGGEDPLYVARRLVRFASEDVGLADPHALTLAISARESVHFLGLPEGALALAELVVYLAAAPKSNSVYLAWDRARKDALESRAEPPPLHIRNAPTGLMKDIGYGAEYRYAHDEPEGVAAMDCLPDGLRGRMYYEPVERGREKEIADRLRAFAELRKKKRTDGQPPGGGL